MSEQWLSIVEYARTFAVSDMTIRRRIKTGRLQAVLKEGKYFIPVTVDKNGNLIRKSVSTQNPSHPSSTGFATNQESREKNHDIVVVKGHPAAEKTFTRPMTHAHHAPVQQPDQAAIQSAMSITTTVGTTSEQTLVDAKALLVFCTASLKRIQEQEARVEERFNDRFFALDSALKNKDMEIRQLKQQVEDLQVLIKVLEKN